jgi:hypothetical protein
VRQAAGALAQQQALRQALEEAVAAERRVVPAGALALAEAAA